MFRRFYAHFVFANAVCLLLGEKDAAGIVVPTLKSEGGERETAVSKTNKTAPCSSRGLCKSSAAIVDEANCFCDQYCHLFDDCCQDAQPWNESTSQRSLVEGATCRKLHDTFQYVIDRCPKGTLNDVTSNDVTKTLCEDDTEVENNTLSNLPVTGISSGLVYKNIYCATCHGVQKQPEGFVFWNQEVVCSWQAEHSPATDGDWGKVSDEQLVIESVRAIDWEHCSLMVTPPSEELQLGRKCVLCVRSCASNWNDSETANKCTKGATNYTYRTTDGSREVYKNEFCALCNFVNLSTLTCDSSPSGDQHAKLVRDSPTLSLRMLLDLNRGKLNHVSRGYEVKLLHREIFITKCPQNTIFELLRSTCQSLFCEPPYTMTLQGHCELNLKNGTANNATGSMPHMDNTACSLGLINSSDYVINENEAVYVTSLNRTYQRGHYVINADGTLNVCISDPVVAETREPQDPFAMPAYLIESYISVVGYALSLTALAVLFIVYLLLPELRNLPGKCLLSLTTSLFLAQLLFLLASLPRPSTWLCFVLSIFTHYFYLAAFCWKSVLAFDTWRTFQFNSLRSPEATSRGTKRFLIYSLLAWLTPLAVVTVAVLVDLEVMPAVATFRPGYGRIYCWISSMSGLLLFFAGPIAVLLTLNIVWFVLTVRNICRTGRSSAVASKGRPHSLSTKTFLVLYIKLSLIMGLTWVFGLLANLSPESLVLWYLFIIFGSLQGLFICIGFTCNRKVYRLLKRRGGGGSRGSMTLSNRVSPQSAFYRRSDPDSR